MTVQSHGAGATHLMPRLHPVVAYYATVAVRVVLLAGFVVIAWAVSALLSEAAAHADTQASSFDDSHVSTGSAAAGQSTVATSSALAPAAGDDGLLSTLAGWTTHENAPWVVGTQPKLDPSSLDSVLAPLKQVVTPVAQPALAPVVSALDTTSQAVPSAENTVNPSVTPVGEPLLDSTVSANSAPGVAPHAKHLVADSGKAAQDTRGVPAAPTAPRPANVPLPLGIAGGSNGSSAAPQFSGAAAVVSEYVFGPVQDLAVANATEIAQVRSHVLENPTFSPD